MQVFPDCDCFSSSTISIIQRQLTVRQIPVTSGRDIEDKAVKLFHHTSKYELVAQQTSEIVAFDLTLGEPAFNLVYDITSDNVIICNRTTQKLSQYH